MIRQVMPMQVTSVGEDEVEVRMSTSTKARDGHILVPQGVRLENYRSNPVFLWNHDTELPPVARSEDIRVEADEIISRVRFAPKGISARADEVRGLVKAGFISGVSVGFDPLDGEPLDVKKGSRGGMRITDWEMLECSFCAVPVDPNSLVTQRARRDAKPGGDWHCATSRGLPIDTRADVTAVTEDEIFEWAGGEDFDPKKARKAFLAYDARAPKERSSYRLPIAHVVEGRLTVSNFAIRSAATRLSGIDIPEAAREEAQAALEHYEERTGMKTTTQDKGKRSMALAPAKPTFTRGLYGLSQLAYLVAQLGYIHECSVCEEDMEGDEASQVPGMLGESLQKLGEALCAMSKEEVAELLAARGIDEDDDVPEGERAFVGAAKTPAARAWRAGIAGIRQRALQKEAGKVVAEAIGHGNRAIKHQKSVGENHDAAAAHIEEASAAHSKAAKAHGDIGDALSNVTSDPEKATEHVARAVKAHKALGAAQTAMDKAHTDAGERLGDAQDSNASMGRCVGAAMRCMRSLKSGGDDGSESDGATSDGDSKTVQTSSGVDSSGGSTNGRSLSFEQRRREVEVMELSVTD